MTSTQFTFAVGRTGPLITGETGEYVLMDVLVPASPGPVRLMADAQAAELELLRILETQGLGFGRGVAFVTLVSQRDIMTPAAPHRRPASEP